MAHRLQGNPTDARPFSVLSAAVVPDSMATWNRGAKYGEDMIRGWEVCRSGPGVAECRTRALPERSSAQPLAAEKGMQCRFRARENASRATELSLTCSVACETCLAWELTGLYDVLSAADEIYKGRAKTSRAGCRARMISSEKVEVHSNLQTSRREGHMCSVQGRLLIASSRILARVGQKAERRAPHKPTSWKNLSSLLQTATILTVVLSIYRGT